MRNPDNTQNFLQPEARTCASGNQLVIFEQVMHSLESFIAMHVCLYDIANIFIGPKGQSLLRIARRTHTTPFCRGVKRTQLSACLQSDQKELIDLCDKNQEPFIHTCHAGASEVIVPVHEYGRLLCILCVGPFQTEPDRKRPLPVFQKDNCKTFLSLAPLLRSFVFAVIKGAEKERAAFQGGRAEKIFSFLSANAGRRCSVRDLAFHLCLSKSRASHLVREQTGKTFRVLLEEKRLGIAKDLLAGSSATVDFVAGQAGFSDLNYFYKYFRSKTGTTPGEFRKKHGINEQV